MGSLIVCSLLAQFGSAQQSLPANIRHACSLEKRDAHATMKPTVADPAEDHYDVKHIFMNLTARSSNTAIGGAVATTAIVVAPTMPAYVFELNPAYTIDSVKINGQILPHTSNNFVHTVALPTPLAQNTTFTAAVFYSGQLTGGGGGFFSNGIRNQASPSWGTRVTYTLSQPYDARDWWPCKQSLQDKIDSATIWLTVPDTTLAGSNGVLRRIDTLPNNFHRFRWKTLLPTDYYLFSIAVAPYTNYMYKVALPNSTDSVRYQNFVYTNPQTLPFWKDEIDSVANMIQHFSLLFGKYPFWQEKYGHCMAPLQGGMEHQTMSTQGNFNPTLSAHELLHQWFGDYVTCGTWKDIWLNEGFASYGEYLFVDSFRGHAAAFNYMQDVHASVMSQPDGSVYCPDTTDENRIFDSRLSYDKGSAAIHTLRYIINNDTAFYSMLRDYLQQFKFSTATTDQFKSHAQTYLGTNLDTFFTEWIYGEGFPTYGGSWAQTGGNINIVLNQSTTATIPFFHNPIDLRLNGALGDTIIRLLPQATGQTFNITWSDTVLSIDVDPNNWVVNGATAFSYDPTLSVASIAKRTVGVYPNPAHAEWTVVGLKPGNTLQLADINGKVLSTTTAADGAIKIPALHLASGIYWLRVVDANDATVIRLIKQ